MLELKTIYEVEIISYKGLYNIKNNIDKNKYILLFILMFILIIYIISNLTLSIKIYSNDTNIINIINDELDKNNIKKYRFKKNYNDIEKIKEEILNKYKDKLEWLEIKYNGTKVIVKVEPRVIKNIEFNDFPRDIVSKKDAIIYKMNISKGTILKDVNSYVKKGDIIVSGEVKLNENIINTYASIGKVYGEVWYTTKVSYPIKYYEEKETKNKKNIISINFLSKKIELFSFKKYKHKSIKIYNIFKNNLLPISINLEKQKEKIIINKKYDKKELIEEAIKYSNNKIKDKLKKDEFIKDYKIISTSFDKDKVNLKIFYSIIEEIGEYKQIVNNMSNN